MTIDFISGSDASAYVFSEKPFDDFLELFESGSMSLAHAIPFFIYLIFF